MGMLSAILIRLDGWHHCRQHPEEFMDAIERGFNPSTGNQVNDYPIGNFHSPVAIASAKHADVPQVFLAWRNSFVDLNDIRSAKKSLGDLKFQKTCIDLSKSCIEAAEENMKDVVLQRVFKIMKEEGIELDDINEENLLSYLKKDDWVKELKLSVKPLAKYGVKNKCYIKAY